MDHQKEDLSILERIYILLSDRNLVSAMKWVENKMNSEFASIDVKFNSWLTEETTNKQSEFKQFEDDVQITSNLHKCKENQASDILLAASKSLECEAKKNFSVSYKERLNRWHMHEKNYLRQMEADYVENQNEQKMYNLHKLHFLRYLENFNDKNQTCAYLAGEEVTESCFDAAKAVESSSKFEDHSFYEALGSFKS